MCSWHIYFIISGTKYNENVFLIFDVITNLLMSWHVFDVMHDELFDVMAYFWLYYKLFNIMTYFSLYFKQLMYFWRHDKPFEVMTCFWRHDIFNVMTNLTPWRMFWRHDVFLTSWTFWHHDALLDVMTSLSSVDNINIIHNQIHTNISEWWCGQTLLGRYYVCPNTTTHHTIRPI